jgi:hypothetical protein
VTVIGPPVTPDPPAAVSPVAHCPEYSVVGHDIVPTKVPTQAAAAALAPVAHDEPLPDWLQLQTPHWHWHPHPQSWFVLHAGSSTYVHEGTMLPVVGPPGLGVQESARPPPSKVGDSGVVAAASAGGVPASTRAGLGSTGSG